jgi:hypothetical protein
MGLSAAIRTVLFNPQPKSILAISGANKSITGGNLEEGRTSSATFIDTDGLLKTAAANVPVWENGGLRHEGAATNAITSNNDFTNAVYLKDNGPGAYQGTGSPPVITKDYAAGPNGSTLCCRVQLALNGGTTLGDRSGFRHDLTLSNGAANNTNFFIKILDTNTIDAILATSLGILVTDAALLSNTYQSLANGWYRVKKIYGVGTATSSSMRIQIAGTQGINALDCLIAYPQEVQSSMVTSSIPTTSATTRATCALSIPLILNQNFFQKSAIVMRVRAKWANSATAKSWLTPSTTTEGLIDNGSGALTFKDSAANTATANLTSWAADTIILVAIVTDNVTGLMSLSASKDNGATWVTSSDTTFAGLTVGANWLLFSANTQVFECLGWNVIKSNKSFAQMKAYAKANALRLTQ